MQKKTVVISNSSDRPDSSDKTDFTPLPDSVHYINKLESRLSKIKGSKNLTPKDMINVMQNARDDLMSHLIASSSNQELFFEDNFDKEVTTSYIERKLFPEKNGVTYEELQHLLECDVLAKRTGEKSFDSSNHNSLDR